MRRCGHGLGARRVRHRSHGALGIQQVIFAGAQAQLDQSPGIGYGLDLPAVVGLVAAHSLLASLVPSAGRFAFQVVFANQGLLDRLGSFGVNFQLAAHAFFSRALSR